MQAFTLVTRLHELASRTFCSAIKHQRRVPKRPTKLVPGFCFRAGTHEFPQDPGGKNVPSQNPRRYAALM